MKLSGLIPNFFIHISGSNLYIPTIGLIWNLYFPVMHERTLSSIAEISHTVNDQHTNFQFGKFQVINGNN